MLLEEDESDCVLLSTETLRHDEVKNKSDNRSLWDLTPVSHSQSWLEFWKLFFLRFILRIVITKLPISRKLHTMSIHLTIYLITSILHPHLILSGPRTIPAINKHDMEERYHRTKVICSLTINDLKICICVPTRSYLQLETENSC